MKGSDSACGSCRVKKNPYFQNVKLSPMNPTVHVGKGEGGRRLIHVKRFLGFQSDRRTTSTCESMASTATAASDGEDDVSSSEEDNGDGDDSDTASAPSPTMMQEEEGQNGRSLICSDD